jgi:hypothetical protein
VMVPRSTQTTGLERRMRTVLLKLALISNGTVSKHDANSGGGSVRYRTTITPRLGFRDAPHLYWLEQWNSAVDDAEREDVIHDAEEELDAIHHSAADPQASETSEQRARRIVVDLAGWPDTDVARHMRGGVREVHKARRAAGQDEKDGSPLPGPGAEQLQAEYRRHAARAYNAEGMAATRIARKLGASVSTIRRDLGLKASRPAADGDDT